ncbi:MAG: aldehyde dehydrogenase family protein [Opitutaceae bacterium]
MAAVTTNSGRVCCTASRWVVHQTIYDRFVSATVDRLKSIRIGYGQDPETQMGPVVSKKHLERVTSCVRRGHKEGADLISALLPAEWGHIRASIRRSM